MDRKIHVALNTNKFEESLAFYRGFFGKEPVKTKPGYAKFDLDSPGLNFTLNQTSHAPKNPGALNHLGIQVDSPEDVQQAIQRLDGAGFETLEEKDTVCCYALQDKVWVTDPNGYRWEVFTVKEGDVFDESDPAVQAAAKATATLDVVEPCCDPGCCS